MRGKPTRKTILTLAPTPWGSIFARSMPSQRPVKGVWVHPEVLFRMAREIDMDMRAEAMFRDRRAPDAPQPTQVSPAS